jgi:hypothetical protein
MKNMHKIAARTTLAIAAFLIPLVLVSPVAFACTDNSGGACGGPSGNTASATPTSTAQAQTDCNDSSDAGVQKCLKNNQIVKDLNFVVNFLAAGVGIVVIGTIIVGGVQYTLAGDNSTATSAAKQRITNGLIALAVFIFSFAFLQWLIPGGL